MSNPRRVVQEGTPIRKLVFVIIASLLAAASPARAALPPCVTTSLAFGAPHRIGTENGYEPAIEVDSSGTIFVTATKDHELPQSGRLGSMLWRSTDLGRTFTEMQAMTDPHRAVFGFEGDLAVDGRDRLYFADTSAFDAELTRFGRHGTTTDLYRPAIPTAELDDRPWIAAHGDGAVYYVSNTAYKNDGRLTVHRSLDAGATFDPVGFTFPKSGWGTIAADPRSRYVYAFVNDLLYGPPPWMNATHLTAWISPDRAATWRKVDVAPYLRGYDQTSDHEDAYPSIAVSPRDGSVVALWTDDGRALRLARSTDHGAHWTITDVTPFSATYSFPWVTVGRNGNVGITFEAQPAGSSMAHIYAMVWRSAAGCVRSGRTCAGPAEAFARVPGTDFTDYGSQADFFRARFLPDETLALVFTGSDGATVTGRTAMFSREAGGPNLGGRAWCGRLGRA